MSMGSFEKSLQRIICSILNAETFYTEAELDDIVDACVIHSKSHLINSTTTFKMEPECSKMQPFFSWLPVKVIKKTFEFTT